MKTPLLAAAVAVLVLVAGCSTTSHQVQSSATPAATAVSRLGRSEVRIISAVYGSGRTFVDVTQRVDDLLNRLPKGFRARPGQMQIDPTPDTTKILVIVYEYKGLQHTLTKGQRGKVTIQILQDAANHPA